MWVTPKYLPVVLNTVGGAHYERLILKSYRYRRNILIRAPTPWGSLYAIPYILLCVSGYYPHSMYQLNGQHIQPLYSSTNYITF